MISYNNIEPNYNYHQSVIRIKWRLFSSWCYALALGLVKNAIIVVRLVNATLPTITTVSYVEPIEVTMECLSLVCATVHPKPTRMKRVTANQITSTINLKKQWPLLSSSSPSSSQVSLFSLEAWSTFYIRLSKMCKKYPW